MVRSLLRTEDGALRRRKLEILHGLIVDAHTDLEPSDRVVLHLDTVSVDPLHADAAPLQRVVLGHVGPPLQRRRRVPQRQRLAHGGGRRRQWPHMPAAQPK